MGLRELFPPAGSRPARPSRAFSIMRPPFVRWPMATAQQRPASTGHICTLAPPALDQSDVVAAVADGVIASPSSSPIGTSTLPLAPEYIYDYSQLRPVPPQPPDLRDLNGCLDALSAVFPDVQLEVFREMLAHFDGESRLAVVADALLKNRAFWVKGRWRVAAEAPSSAPLPPPPMSPLPAQAAVTATVPPRERFRSQEFQEAVRTLAWTEFKGLSKATINAVLAESNYSYLEARPTLVSISAKSWRFTLSSLLFRRRSPPVGSTPVSTTGTDTSAHHELENHPLVVWRSSGRGSILPTIRTTDSPELDAELYTALVAPLRRWKIEAQLTADRALALQLLELEAEQLGILLECECCYTFAPCEAMASCSADGHLVCFDCVRHAATEAVFGQGWQSSVVRQAGSLRCLSANAAAHECDGHLPRDLLRRALAEPHSVGPGFSIPEAVEQGGADNDLLARLDRRIAELNLVDSGLPLVRCPFCDYAEVDEIYIPEGAEERLRLQAGSLYTAIFLVLCLCMVPLVMPLLALVSLLCLAISSNRTIRDWFAAEWRRAIHRGRRRRRGARFVCQRLAGGCGRASCLLCGKGWTDVHVCHESSLVALRTQVEQAMSNAVKRVCPRCATAFVKSAGCNKLTCPCGYKMCYLCRADLADDGYLHFCNHFRPDGAATAADCADCDRCSLWKIEDTETVLRSARADAERRWRAAEPRDLTPAERAYLETGLASAASSASSSPASPAASWRIPDDAGLLARLRSVPTLAQTCDAVVELLYH